MLSVEIDYVLKLWQLILKMKEAEKLKITQTLARGVYVCFLKYQ